MASSSFGEGKRARARVGKLNRALRLPRVWRPARSGLVRFGFATCQRAGVRPALFPSMRIFVSFSLILSLIPLNSRATRERPEFWGIPGKSQQKEREREKAHTDRTEIGFAEVGLEKGLLGGESRSFFLYLSLSLSFFISSTSVC